MRELKGKLGSAPDLQIGIVIAQFYDHIAQSLRQGVLDTLESHGIPSENITIAYVPGAFELPLACKHLASRCDAVIALGCVIRGETPHFDYVCSQAAAGIQQVALSQDTPVIFGVLTTETMEQAVERSQTKGSDLAKAALEMVSVLHQIEEDKLTFA